jgi:rapamycin-insensitive companion of mTOR
LYNNNLQGVLSIKTNIDSTTLDETQFTNLINDSKLLSLTVDKSKKWVWTFIPQIIYSLKNPNRLKDAIKQKLVKKIISFYQPSKKQFPELDYKEENTIYSELAISLFEILLQTKDGYTEIEHSGFLEDLKDHLEIELQESPNSNMRIFSPSQVTHFMSREYFAIIGLFSSIPSGIELLKENKIFDILTTLTREKYKRDDVVQLIIKYLDYTHFTSNLSKFSRDILKEAMVSGSKKIRYFSTLRIKVLLNECRKVDFQKLGVNLLNIQVFPSY